MEKKITIAEAIDFYYDHPVEFFQDILGMDPDPWQRDVLEALAKGNRVSVRSGQGVGKTAIEAGAILWFLVCRPYAKVVATAPTMQQLYDVLWSEISKWLKRSPLTEFLKWTKTKVYVVGDGERWFATAKTATNAESMQGWHEDHMLIVVDEASGVADDILEAILGTLSGWDNKLLMCGNPNRLSGVFYDSHNRSRKLFRTFKVSAYDSTRTSRENIRMLEEKYGMDSDVVRVRVHGEFPLGEADTFISRESVEQACVSRLRHDPLKVAEVAHIGVDVARYGSDSTVVASRVGRKMLPYLKANKLSVTETAGRVMAVMRDLRRLVVNLSEIVVKVDDTGVGGGVTDILNAERRRLESELAVRVRVVPVNNGESASDAYYVNLGSQAWGEVRTLLEDNMTALIQGRDPVVEFPKDVELVRQLSDRKFSLTSRGKIQLESKEEMAKRGLGSPDVADAVVLAFWEGGQRTVNVLRGL